MLMRSIVGALTVVGAIGALAAVLPERHAQPKPAPGPTFGAVPKTAASASSPDEGGSKADQQSLVKLAAYTATRDAGVQAPLATSTDVGANSGPVDRPPVRTVRVVGPAVMQPSAVPPVAIASAVVVPPVTPAAPSPVLAPSPAATPAPPTQAAPQTVASLQPTPPEAPAPSSGGRININRASVAQLDHLPGGGRIGAAIARRRPYRSVDDLVRKRVLRADIYARIRSAVTVD